MADGPKTDTEKRAAMAERVTYDDMTGINITGEGEGEPFDLMNTDNFIGWDAVAAEEALKPPNPPARFKRSGT